ncbi:MAG: sulfite exporter TauE/SafE family protein [archaeon]|nr:sulfite exporter TauE/SafE family protein [archaeon]
MPAELSLELIIAAAALDSINPCVFGVLIFLLAYMTKVFKSKSRMLLAGLIYVAAVYITYFLAGIGLLTVIKSTGIGIQFYWLTAFIAIAAGLLEIKDYFWYGKGFSLQLIPGSSERIKKYSEYMGKMETEHPVLSLLIAFLLGVFVVFIELPCTGAPYLAILGMISTGELAEGIPLLLLYNLVFILPLFIIIFLVYIGSSSEKLEAWRKEHRGLMRLLIGLFLFGLGAYMLWTII